MHGRSMEENAHNYSVIASRLKLLVELSFEISPDFRSLHFDRESPVEKDTEMLRCHSAYLVVVYPVSTSAYH